MLKQNADMVKEFFDNCLGSGAGAAVCTEKSNFGLCYDAFTAFIDMVNQQKDSIVNAGDTFRQYTPDRAKRNIK